jgi:hypothetical protein
MISTLSIADMPPLIEPPVKHAGWFPDLDGKMRRCVCTFHVETFVDGCWRPSAQWLTLNLAVNRTLERRAELYPTVKSLRVTYGGDTLWQEDRTL